MSAFDVWLWLKLDDVRTFAFTVCVVAGVAAVLGLVVVAASCAESDKPRRGVVVFRNAAAAACLCAGIALALIPNTKQAAAIYVVPKLVESRVFTNDIPQLYGMAVDALKEKLAVEVAK